MELLTCEELIETASKLRVNISRIQKANCFPKKKTPDGQESNELENPIYEAARKSLIEEAYSYCGIIVSSSQQGFIATESPEEAVSEIGNKIVENYDKLVNPIEDGNIEPFALAIRESRQELRKVFREANGFEYIAYHEAFDAIDEILLGFY